MAGYDKAFNLFLANELEPKVHAILVGDEKNAAKKDKIVKLIKEIPSEFHNADAYTQLLFSFQGWSQFNEKTKDILSRPFEDDIAAEIIGRQLAYTDIRNRQEYIKLRESYFNNEFTGITSTTFGKAGAIMGQISATEDRAVKERLLNVDPNKSKTVVFPKTATLEEALDKILRAIDVKLSRHAVEFLDKGDAVFDSFRQKLYSIIFTSSVNPVAVLIKLKSGASWALIKKKPESFFNYITIEDKNKAKERAVAKADLSFSDTGSDLRNFADSAHKDAMLNKAIKEIAEKLQYWEEGLIICAYRKGAFDIQYYPSGLYDGGFKIPLKWQIPDLERFLARAQESELIDKYIYFLEGIIRDDKPDEGEEEEIEIPDFSQTDCADLLYDDFDSFLNCYLQQRELLAGKYLQTMQGVGSIANAVADAIDPTDPVNFSLPVVAGITKIAKVKKVLTAGKLTVKAKALRNLILTARFTPKEIEIIEKAISRRGNLRRSFHVIGTTQEAHHIIPIFALKTKKSVQYAVLEGFDINDAFTNGHKLWKRSHFEAIHWQKYDKWIFKQIEDWESTQQRFDRKKALNFIKNDLVPRARKTIDMHNAIY